MNGFEVHILYSNHLFQILIFQAGESVQELLKSAKERIPAKYWSKTPITLKATAGLRLLPQEQSEAIINEVKKVLENSGFQTITDEKLIEIMNPMEEGLFAWFTVNYLLGSFGSNKHLSESAASLDLGGGSTQITFAPKTLPVAGIEGRKHFIHKVDILDGDPWNVYRLVIVVANSFLKTCSSLCFLLD